MCRCCRQVLTRGESAKAITALGSESVSGPIGPNAAIDARWVLGQSSTKWIASSLPPPQSLHMGEMVLSLLWE